MHRVDNVKRGRAMIKNCPYRMDGCEQDVNSLLSVVLHGFGYTTEQVGHASVCYRRLERSGPGHCRKLTLYMRVVYIFLLQISPLIVEVHLV